MHAVRVGRGDVVYCTVTCGARDYNQSRPNPTVPASYIRMCCIVSDLKLCSKK